MHKREEQTRSKVQVARDLSQRQEAKDVWKWCILTSGAFCLHSQLSWHRHGIRKVLYTYGILCLLSQLSWPGFWVRNCLQQWYGPLPVLWMILPGKHYSERVCVCVYVCVCEEQHRWTRPTKAKHGSAQGSRHRSKKKKKKKCDSAHRQATTARDPRTLRAPVAGPSSPQGKAF